MWHCSGMVSDHIEPFLAGSRNQGPGASIYPSHQCPPHVSSRAFIDVNDPYVFERLMAVAYGCAMRSEDTEAIGSLAADIYAWVFRDGHPPVHILARDYARGVIEVAVHRGIALDIDMSKVRPPYNSTFPDNIPTEEELRAKYDNFDAAKRDIDYAQSTIWLSVMNGGTLRATSLVPIAARLSGHHGDWARHPHQHAKSGMRHLSQR